MPAFLFEPGPQNLAYWQWGGLVLVLLAAALLGLLLGRLSRSLLLHLAARTSVTWDDVLAARISGPLSIFWFLLSFAILRPALDLNPPVAPVVQGLLRGSLLVTLFWGLSRSVDVIRQVIAESRWAKEHPASRSLLPLGARVVKLINAAFAVIALLHELGYPVASLIAGLGIGGLAVALAAQKSMENLFGAFAIGADQPFREGDFVRVDDLVGTVEYIGLRSTRIRTLDRTLVSIPNGKLADMRLETFAARDRIRLSVTLPLLLCTSVASVRQALANIDDVLKSHPKLWPDDRTVCLKEIGSSALVIEVMAWFVTSDWSEFVRIREEVLLQFLEAVERAGTSLAYPTTTVNLSRMRQVP